MRRMKENNEKGWKTNERPVRNRKNKQLKTTVENEWNYNMNKKEWTKEIKAQMEEWKRRTKSKSMEAQTNEWTQPKYKTKQKQGGLYFIRVSWLTRLFLVTGTAVTSTGSRSTALTKRASATATAQITWTHLRTGHQTHGLYAGFVWQTSMNRCHVASHNWHEIWEKQSLRY